MGAQVLLRDDGREVIYFFALDKASGELSSLKRIIVLNLITSL
jgi:hypothetical protein